MSTTCWINKKEAEELGVSFTEVKDRVFRPCPLCEDPHAGCECEYDESRYSQEVVGYKVVLPQGLGEGFVHSTVAHNYFSCGSANQALAVWFSRYTSAEFN